MAILPPPPSAAASTTALLPCVRLAPLILLRPSTASPLRHAVSSRLHFSRASSSAANGPRRGLLSPERRRGPPRPPVPAAPEGRGRRLCHSPGRCRRILWAGGEEEGFGRVVHGPGGSGRGGGRYRGLVGDRREGAAQGVRLGGYAELVALAGRFGLKVRAIIGFHQRGTGPGDPCWTPLPTWVLEELDTDLEMAYSDRFGRRSKEYISLGCDVLPVLKGRSPIQAYSDFLRHFRDTFKEYLGGVITEVQIGMGPSGELRYPSSEKLMKSAGLPELGEFQCYDKFMITSLDACARGAGMREWGSGGPFGAWSLLRNPEQTEFFKTDGSWNTAYGRFFLEWYSGILLMHGERLCMAADNIFLGTGVKLLGKIAGIHWHYGTNSHPSELTAGYYNTLIRDGYIAIARMFARYRVTLCCTCFDMRDADVEDIYPRSSPEGFLRQVVHAARICNLPLTGENSRNRMDDSSLQQVIKSSKLYKDGFNGSSLSFNFVRMNKNIFEAQNWTRFTRFVRQMSDSRTFQAKLDLGGLGGTESSHISRNCISSFSAAEEVRAFAYQ